MCAYASSGTRGAERWREFLKLLGYAAVAHFVVKLVHGTAIIENLEISCEHRHATVAEAAACAWLQNRSLPLYPYWCAHRIEEDVSGVIFYVYPGAAREVAEHRETNMTLFGWRERFGQHS